MELTLKVAQDVFGMREGKHYKLYLSSPMAIDFSPMGLNHELSFRSADNPLHFVSASLTHWRWSEAGISKADVFDKLGDRLRDLRGKVLQGLIDGTPEGLNHWSDIGDIAGVGKDRVNAELNRRRFIVETGDNNANLTPGYVEALRSRYSYDPSKLLSYEKGLFVPFTKGSAYWAFNDIINIVDNDIVATNEKELILSFDFNVSPMAWVVAQKYHERLKNGRRIDKYIIIDECSGNTIGLMDAIAEFAVKFPIHTFANTPIKIYGDRNGWSRDLHTAESSYKVIEQYLKSLDYNRVEVLASQGQNPLVKDRLEKIAAIMSYRHMAVCQRCVKTIESFRKTIFKEGTWDIAKKGDDKHSHWADAASYFLYQIFKGINVSDPDAEHIYGIR